MRVELTRPDIVYTHESDLDGLLSGLLLRQMAKELFGADVPLYALHNHTWRQRQLNDRNAWVADFAFESRLDRPGWIVFDHHATDVTPRNARLVHDASKSAALLVYETCRDHGMGSPTLDRLVHLNNVADLFLEDDPEFVLACDYANLVKSYGFWSLHSLIEGDPARLLDHPLLEVMAAKRRVEDPIGLAWSRQNIQEISPTVGLVHTVIGNTNQVIRQIFELKCTRFPVLLTLFRRGNGIILASLRSRNGEALKVAEKLQGGGHPNASGATLPRSIQNIPDAIAYLRQVLNPAQKDPRSINSLEHMFDSLPGR